jgi:drug/metabolite transporter (DMT)-like permease
MPPMLSFPRDRNYLFGLACIFTGSIFTSISGILIRGIEAADGWQIQFYRSLGMIAVMLPFIVYRHRRATLRAFRATGRPGAVVAICLASAFTSMIFALLSTTVANVVFVVGAVPFFAALLGWLILREPVGRGLWLAMAAALVGIAIMVGGSLTPSGLLGMAFAMNSCLFYSVVVVALRRGRSVDMQPAVCTAGMVAAVVSAVMLDSFHVSGHDLVLILILGVVQVGFQFILVTAGSRYVPAAEIALLGRVSIVLAPLWVWIGVNEVPATATLVGGAIVLVTAVGHSLSNLRRG